MTFPKNNWFPFFEEQAALPYFKKLEAFLAKAEAEETVYPPAADRFRAFALTDLPDVRLVLLGQDPYHGPGQAQGLSFSLASPAAKFPPSLGNIWKELATDLGINRTDADLSSWAHQGVLLLNTVLSVSAGKAGSHRGQGWEIFTDAVLKKLNQGDNRLIFILWGNDAKAKIPLINTDKHSILTAPHPSPLSAYRGFFGSRPFSGANNILISQGQTPIQW